MRFFAVFLLLIASAAFAQDPVVSVTWDAVNDSRVGKYVVGVGSETGVYPNEVTVEETDLTADVPGYGYDTYYIVVKACKDDLSLCSEWSNELAWDHEIGTPGNLRRAVEQLQGAVDKLNTVTTALASVVDEM